MDTKVYLYAEVFSASVFHVRAKEPEDISLLLKTCCEGFAEGLRTHPAPPPVRTSNVVPPAEIIPLTKTSPQDF